MPVIMQLIEAEQFQTASPESASSLEQYSALHSSIWAQFNLPVAKYPLLSMDEKCKANPRVDLY